MRYEQQPLEGVNETSSGIAERLESFPSWLLDFTDELIQSPFPSDQDLAHDLLDLYRAYGDEVEGLIPKQHSTPAQIHCLGQISLDVSVF